MFTKIISKYKYDNFDSLKKQNQEKKEKITKESGMFKGDNYSHLTIPSQFGKKRQGTNGYYYHTGVDYNSPLFKKQPLYNNINGLLSNIQLNDKFYGKIITIKSNPKFVDLINDKLYTDYCHCSSISERLLRSFNNFNDDDPNNNIILVNAGEVIGFMGNTGHCMTNDKVTDKWRDITEKEKNDPNINYGVHLHLTMYQFCKDQEITPLLKDMKQKGIITKPEHSQYFWQWNKLFINPIKIYEYFKETM